MDRDLLWKYCTVYQSHAQGEILQLRLEALKTPEKQTPECPRWNSLRLCELHPLYNASFRWLGWLIWLVVVLSRLSIFTCRCRQSMRVWGKNYWKVVAWWLITQWRGKCGVPVVNLMQNESFLPFICISTLSIEVRRGKPLSNYCQGQNRFEKKKNVLK